MAQLNFKPLLRSFLLHVPVAIHSKSVEIGKNILQCSEKIDLEPHLASFVLNLCNMSTDIGLIRLKAVVLDMCIIVEKLHAACAEEMIPSHPAADVNMSLDELLRLLEVAFDAALTVLGPAAGLDPKQIAQAEADLHALVVTIEGLEHRDIEAQTGAEMIVRQLMKLLNDFGVDPHFPTDDTPTALDAALEALRGVLDGALELYGPRYNLDPYTISRLEADLAGLEADIRSIEHGHTPLTDGLVRIVDDVFNMLRDFGVPVLDIDSAVGLAEKSVLLRKQLGTLLRVFSAHQSPHSGLPADAMTELSQLEDHLVALGEGRDGVTLFEVVHDMTQVGRHFVHVLA